MVLLNALGYAGRGKLRWPQSLDPTGLANKGIKMSSEDWYRKRNYLHFDRPVSEKTAAKIIKNPQTVAAHSFYPFINYSIHSSKIYKDDNDQIAVKEKNRPISYAAHLDSHIYSYYCHILTPLYEKQLRESDLERSILAFRKLGKSNVDFAFEAFNEIKSLGEKFGGCTAIGFDITGFFDNLDHDLLKQSWQQIINSDSLPDDHYAVFKSLTKYSKVDKQSLYKLLNISEHNPKNNRFRVCTPEEFRTIVRPNALIVKNLDQKGIPQGSPISAFLSNIYMLNFDKLMSEAVKEIGATYYRYCDDMLFIVPIEYESTLAGFVRKELNKLKIDINPNKTEIRQFISLANRFLSDKPLQYLGFLYDGEKILIRSAALAKYSERMRRGIRLAKKTKIKRNRIKISIGQKPTKLYKRKIYERYSHLGGRNFIKYGLKAAKLMNSAAIKKQLKPLWNRLQEEIKK